jgi:hypothetical protein
VNQAPVSQTPAYAVKGLVVTVFITSAAGGFSAVRLRRIEVEIDAFRV